MKRKILGIPMFAVVSVILALVVSGGAVLGLWFFEAQQPGTEVIGSGVALFQDLECTIPLTEVDILDWGEVRADGASTMAPVFYAKNVATDDVKVSLSEVGLPDFLALTYIGNLIGTEPTRLLLVNDLAEDLLTDTLHWAVDDTQATIQVTGGGQGWIESALRTALGYDPEVLIADFEGILQIEDELIVWTGIDVQINDFYLLNCQRGSFATLPVAHALDVVIAMGNDTAPSLIPDEVMAIILDMAAGPEVEFNDKAFTVIITAENDQ